MCLTSGARLKVIVIIQERDITRKFTIPETLNREIQKEYATEPEGVKSAAYLRSQTIRGMIP